MIFRRNHPPPHNSLYKLKDSAKFVPMNRLPLYLAITLLLLGCASSKKRAKKAYSKGWDLIDSRKNYNNVATANAAKSVSYFQKAIRLDPAESRYYNGLGLAYYYMGLYNPAIEQFNIVLGLAKWSLAAYNNRGMTYKAAGNYKAALDDYLTAKNLDPKDADIYYNIGLLYVEMDDYEKGIKYYTKAIELNPGYLYSYNNRAVAYRLSGKFDLAMKDLNYVISVDSNYYSALLERGLVNYYSKKYDQALIALDRCMRATKNPWEVHLYKGLTYNKLNDTAATLREYREARKLNPNASKVYAYFASFYNDQGQYRKAVYYYTEAIKIRGAINYYCDRAVNYHNAGDTTSALTDLKKVYEMDSTYHYLYNERGLIAYERKQYAAAMADFDKALKYKPTYAPSLNNKGITYVELKKYDEAKACYFKTLASDSTNTFALDNLARLYSRHYSPVNMDSALYYYNMELKYAKRKRSVYYSIASAYQHNKLFQAAANYYSKALGEDSTHVYSLNARGMCYSRINKFDSAEVDLLKCIRLDPKYEYPYNNLANSYFANGHKDKACEYWNKAISIGYVYKPEWREEYDIEDPHDLVKKYCSTEVLVPPGK